MVVAVVTMVLLDTLVFCWSQLWWSNLCACQIRTQNSAEADRGPGRSKVLCRNCCVVHFRLLAGLACGQLRVVHVASGRRCRRRGSRAPAAGCTAAAAANGAAGCAGAAARGAAGPSHGWPVVLLVAQGLLRTVPQVPVVVVTLVRLVALVLLHVVPPVSDVVLPLGLMVALVLHRALLLVALGLLREALLVQVVVVTLVYAGCADASACARAVAFTRGTTNSGLCARSSSAAGGSSASVSSAGRRSLAHRQTCRQRGWAFRRRRPRRL